MRDLPFPPLTIVELTFHVIRRDEDRKRRGVQYQPAQRGAKSVNDQRAVSLTPRCTFCKYANHFRFHFTLLVSCLFWLPSVLNAARMYERLSVVLLGYARPAKQGVVKTNLSR